MLLILSLNLLGDGLRMHWIQGLDRRQFMKALEIRDLYVKYVLDDEVIHALNGINLSIEKGKTLGLVGELSR